MKRFHQYFYTSVEARLCSVFDPHLYHCPLTFFICAALCFLELILSAPVKFSPSEI